MELTEKIETINQRLIDFFGVDTITGRPIWRVVWSEDQFEKRLMNTTDAGILLIKPEVREVPKYRQWIKEKYVLERLVLVPSISQNELPTSKLSYEPMLVFRDKDDNFLPPLFDICKIAIDSVYFAQGKGGLRKYTDPDKDEVDPEIAKAKHRARVDELYNSMFGEEESGLKGALVDRTGIVVPNNYDNKKES